MLHSLKCPDDRRAVYIQTGSHLSQDNYVMQRTGGVNAGFAWHMAQIQDPHLLANNEMSLPDLVNNETTSLLPYMDGNGRIGRFLMNVMLAAGGYPWTVIPLEKRNDYMAALENGSVGQDIVPFAVFLKRLVSERSEGKQAPQGPIN